MKYLFYILVIINLVFLGWKLGVDPQRFIAEDSATQPLEMPLADQPMPVEELDEAELLPTEPDPLVKPPEDLENPNGDLICLEMGPFSERPEADAALALLKTLGKDIQVRIHPSDTPNGWWVIYPKANSREAAMANRQMLMNKGVYENWLFDRGPLVGAISLGLYQSQADAEKALLGYKEKGINAKVRPRLVRANGFWLRVPWDKPRLELDEAIQLINSGDANIKIPSPTPCP